jgi:hypothetical protein
MLPFSNLQGGSPFLINCFQLKSVLLTLVDGSLSFEFGLHGSLLAKERLISTLTRKQSCAPL